MNKRNRTRPYIEDSDFEGVNEDGDTDSTYLDQWEESLRILHVCENNSLATFSSSGNSVYLPLKKNVKENNRTSRP